MPSACLWIVGATGRAAAFSALRSGLRPRVCDRFADTDAARLCRTTRIAPYPEAIFRLLGGRSTPVDWIYTGALENRPDVIGAVAARHRLLGNGADVVRLARHPMVLHAVLRRAGLCVPECRLHAARLPGDGSWLRKPFASGGGHGIAVWRGEAGGPFLPANGAYFFQQRIDGLACSALYVAARGSAVLLGLTRQLVGTDWCGAPPYAYAGSVGPWQPRGQLREQLDAIGATLSRQFRLVGLFGVDFVLQGRRAWAVEVNPRYTASVEVLERGLGISALALHRAACLQGRLPRRPAHRGGRRWNGKAILYAARPIRVPPTWQPPAQPLCWPALADIPAPGTRIGPGQPIATLFSAGRDPTDVLASLRRLTGALQRDLTAGRARDGTSRRKTAAP